MTSTSPRAALRSIALAAALLMPATAPALALDPTDKPEIEKIIREYLLKNPELMLEVQQALEARQREQQQARAAAALADNRQTVFESPNQGVVGNASGDVTVVEFFDYNCGFCQRAMEDMNRLIGTDSQLRFVLKELPILSQGSVEASRVSTAVYRLFPDRYEEFHNKLLGLNGPKDLQRAMEVVAGMGLDAAKISEVAQKDDVLDAFREVNELANSLGINGTPSYVIGNEVVFGALGYDVLREKIENVRKCGETACS